MNPCKCRVCILVRELDPLMAKATPVQRRALDTILCEWESKSTEAVYWEMKFRRTWPEHPTKGK